MHSLFPVPSLQTCVCTGTLVLAAAMPACLFPQAISFGTSLKIDFPNSATYTPLEIVPGDLNGDGNTDLVLMIHTVDSVTTPALQLYLLIGDGSGKFTSMALPMTPHQGGTFMFADVNGDHHQDILYTYSGVLPTPTAPGTPGTFEVWLGDGAGNFRRSSSTTLPVGDVRAEQGDFNGDGKLDVAIMTSLVSTNGQNNETWLSIYLNLGNASFRNAWTLHDVPAYEYLGPVGDYNRDGKQDLVLITQEASHFRVITGNGDGTFTDPKKVTYTLNTDWITTMSSADLNHDGKTDIVVALEPNPGKIAILLAKQTTGFYWYHNLWPEGTFPTTQLVDLNGDGRPDILCLDQAAWTVSVFPGEANALFGREQQLDHAHVGTIVTAPLKSGGLPDIFIGETPDPFNGPGVLRVDLNISK